MAARANILGDLDDGHISFARLQQITNDFSNFQIVSGAPGVRGTVYKGIEEGFGEIAVKRHEVNAPGTNDKGKYSLNVRGIMKQEHKNIVKLLAFCHHQGSKQVLMDGEVCIEDVVETLFCYEYFPRGSLHHNLFGEQAPELDWNTRFKIIKGICEGLKFLHTRPQPIIHLNLKPQNIMLDCDMVPKIADFVYSRIIKPEQSRMITKSSVGSVGYMAPEYSNTPKREISRRFDIYSLGLMIIEIATREKNCPSINQRTARKFIKKVEADWMDTDRIMREYSDLEDGGRHQLNECIKIGLECVNLTQDLRPRIEEIVDRLNGK